jgi:hypothetical protein
MACACKVNKHIDDIQKHYGTTKGVVKTNIRESINVFIKKCLLALIILPFFPIFFIFLIIRKCITNKPISISGFIKLKKNVRN